MMTLISSACRSKRSTALPVVFLLLLAPIVILTECSKSKLPGEQEEVATAPEDVPEGVRAAAAIYRARLGNARIGDWFWDTEDDVWECQVIGLSRRAELDITPEGLFSELELEYKFPEVEKVLPEIARTIREKCRGDMNVFIELSFRRESFLDDIPSLEEAWKQSGVVLEYQCPNGRDFEIDARGMVVTKPIDDIGEERD